MFNYAVGAVNAANDEFQDFPRPVVGIGLQYGINAASGHMSFGETTVQVFQHPGTLPVGDENILVVFVGDWVWFTHQVPIGSV